MIKVYRQVLNNSFLNSKRGMAYQEYAGFFTKEDEQFVVGVREKVVDILGGLYKPYADFITRDGIL